MFHFDKQNPHVLFADNRKLKTTFKDKGKDRHLTINPDVIHDFMDMPYPDKSFKCVIFDPPHLIKGGDKSGRLNNTHWMLFVKGANHIGDDTK